MIHACKTFNEMCQGILYVLFSCELECGLFLLQNNWPSVLFAMAGGVVLSLGNLSTQYAWAFVGLSVTEVLTSSITVVIGINLKTFTCKWVDMGYVLFLMHQTGKTKIFELKGET